MVIAAAAGHRLGVLIIPLAALILPGGIDLGGADWLGFARHPRPRLAGRRAAMGLVLGTAVPPNRISVAFAIVLTPLIFTGAAFYPWPSLSRLELVPGRHPGQPADLRQRGDARLADPTCPTSPPAGSRVGSSPASSAFTLLGVRGFVRPGVD